MHRAKRIKRIKRGVKNYGWIFNTGQFKEVDVILWAF